MKRIFKRVICLLIFGLMAAGALPCVSRENGVITAEASSSVALSKKSVSLRAGGKASVTLKGIKSKKKVKWSSSDTDVVSVKKSGKNGSTAALKGIKAGTAEVTAVYGGKKYTCKVTVKPKPVLSEEKIEIYVGSEVNLTLENPLKRRKTVWQSSNPEAVSVEGYLNQAKITGFGAGSSTVTAIHNGKKYKCKVTVKEIARSMAIANCYSGNLRVGETGQFKCVVRPSNTGGTIKWSSNNTKVAAIDSKGMVTAKSAGIAVITAKTTDGSRLSKSMRIIVVGD